MTKILKRVLTLVLTFMCGIALVSPVFFNAYGNSDGDVRPTHNRYNIVLVVDASGSMATTDPGRLRFEAISKFTALLAERGNTIGTVVFSDEILLRRSMTAVNDITLKREIVEEISAINPLGYTNIGGALYAATQLLDEGANRELPSIILFLSDGNTEMPTLELEEQSLLQKADAIARARDLGYVIHSVSLNADGTANPDELSQISNATGGLFEEVKSAEDLENVYNLFYRVIFNSVDFKNNLTQFPASGVVEGEFRVPAIGVEEINLILSGLAEDYSLTDPHGQVHTAASLSGSTYNSDTFSVIKLVEPVSGDWSYAVSGIPGGQIRIELIFNTNLKAGMSLMPLMAQINETITIKANLTQAGEIVTDSALYEGFSANVVINGNAAAMTPTHDGFLYEFIPGDSGAYTFSARIEGWGHILNAEKITVNVDNVPPVFNEDIHHTIYLLPFSENRAVIDLSPAATDSLGRDLHYEVVSSAFNENEYAIGGNTELIMMPPLGRGGYSLSKGSFEIAAIDPLGGSVNFNVYITTVNVTMWTITLLSVGAAILLTVLGIIAWVNINKRFYGVCYVRQFNHESDEYYDEIEITNPKRGKRRLPSHKLGNIGFSLNKCCFQASGKRHVFLKLNEVVYAQGVKDKKFKIDGEGFEVQISKRPDSVKGIIVRFETHKNR